MLDNNILYWDLRQTGALANTVLPASMLNAFPQNFVLVIPADATFVVHADVPSTSRRLRLQEYRCLEYYNSYLLCKVKGHLHETYCFPAHFFQDFTTTRMFTKNIYNNAICVPFRRLSKLYSTVSIFFVPWFILFVILHVRTYDRWLCNPDCTRSPSWTNLCRRHSPQQY